MSVASNVAGIGADDIVEEARSGADVERLLCKFQRPAGSALVDEQLCAILAASQKNAGKAGAVAVERRAAAADKEFPRTIINAVESRRRGLFVQDRHVSERLLWAFGGKRRGRADERPNNNPMKSHHGASITSERRYAMTLSRSGLSSAK